jgi:DNA-binding NtrC family response regulator
MSRREETTTISMPAPHGATAEQVTRDLMDQRRIAVLALHDGGVEAAVLATGQPVVIGRGEKATLRVASERLSRTHVRLVMVPGSPHVRVEDMGSTNGTWLHGTRVESAEIGPGDEIVIGDVRVRVSPLGPAFEGGTASDGLVAGPEMREVLQIADRAASSAIPVVLLGETGTGKEVVARYLHERGPRAKKAMVSVNCAAIPGQLVESTFFGHERGSFTGATDRRSGLFEDAHEGTIFLDEVGELSLSAQAALLRVLETQRFSRVGSSRDITVDVRVVAATHRNLEEMCEAGAFRQDLYYRLCTLAIAIPPLRERAGDIEPLSRLFLRRASAASGRPVTDLSAEALSALTSYAWPGNVRELRNAVERAVVVAKGSAIELNDLPPKVRGGPAERISALPPLPASARAPLPTIPPAQDDLAGTARSEEDFRSQMQDYERKLLTAALVRAGWNQTQVARELNIPVRTLSYKLKALGIKRPEK